MVSALFSLSESLSGGLSSRVSAAVQLKVMTIKKAMMEVLVIGMLVTLETNSVTQLGFQQDYGAPFYTVSLVFLKVQGPMMMLSGMKVIPVKLLSKGGFGETELRIIMLYRMIIVTLIALTAHKYTVNCTSDLLYQLAQDKKATVQSHYKSDRNGIMWDWAWIRTPISAEEKEQMEELNSCLRQVQLTSVSDKWVWKNDDKNEFTVKSVRCTLARQLNLNEEADSFMWNNWITNKCSMFVWRAMQGKIPTTTQLRQRGVQIPSIICKVCGREDETPDHVLVKCEYAKEVWEQIWNWVKIAGVQKPDTIKEMIETVNDLQWPKVKKKAVHAVFTLTAWRIWKNRNTKVFKERDEAIFKIIEVIKEESYQWMKQRTKLQIASWEEWKYFSWFK